MVRILPTRYADVPNARLLAERLRQLGTLTMDHLADWVERLPDSDKRILSLEFAHCFHTGECVLGEAAQRCVESWRSEGIGKGHSELLDELAEASREDWPGVVHDDSGREPSPPENDAA